MIWWARAVFRNLAVVFFSIRRVMFGHFFIHITKEGNCRPELENESHTTTAN
jgi:hypothetical protein